MILKKTYYSISEVSKILNIHEHTIRFWDSKLPELSTRDQKGKSRFFNKKQIEKLSKLNHILKNNDSISLAFKIISNKNKNFSSNIYNSDRRSDSIKYQENITRIHNTLKKLKNLLN